MGSRGLFRSCIAASLVALIVGSLEDNQQEKDYIDSIVEDDHFEDLTVEQDPLMKEFNVSMPAMSALPPPLLSPTAEDITFSSEAPAENFTGTEVTSSIPQYTILSVASIFDSVDDDNTISTESAENHNETVTAAATTPAVHFQTTLLDEVVTYAPPTEPPIYSTLVHSWGSTRRPPTTLMQSWSRIPQLVSRKLNYGEVKRKGKLMRKPSIRKTTLKTSYKPKKKFAVPKALRVKGNRKLVSHDVGPPGRKIPIPQGWRVTQT